MKKIILLLLIAFVSFTQIQAQQKYRKLETIETTKAASFIGKSVALTDAATISPDVYYGQNFYVTLGGNRTIAAIANWNNGTTLHFYFKQDGTGSRTLTWTNTILWKGGSAPTMTTTAAKTDIIILRKVNDVIYGEASLNY